MHSPTTADAWLALGRAPGVGAAAARRLIETFGSPESALAAPADALRRAGLGEAAIRALQQPDTGDLERDRQWLSGERHHLVTLDDPRYPALLAEIGDAPATLFVIGDPDVLALPQLAMVGSRNPTPGGVENARMFARHLSAAGLPITSGLALGVDGEAHAACIAGGAPTIAVMATGADIIYPAGHRELAGRIIEAGGALVTEFPLGTTPRRGLFPRRNRLISGLALGTLVVEASIRSGSLITARTALEQGREVFALPGSIHNPMARGCHRLIKQGAKLVESADDILEELAGYLHATTTRASAEPPAPEAPATPDPEHARLLESMGHDPVSIDALVERTGLTPETVSSILLIMELEGRVTGMGGGLYTRTHRIE